MNIIESHNIGMAMVDLDIAISELQYLLDDQNFPPDEPDGDRLYDICTYTRFVHANVWRDRLSVSRVQDEIIPLLEDAKWKIEEMKEAGHPSIKDKVKLAHFITNIRLRTDNLRDNYLNGLPPAFAPDEIEPRLRKCLKNVIQAKEAESKRNKLD